MFGLFFAKKISLKKIILLRFPYIFTKLNIILYSKTNILVNNPKLCTSKPFYIQKKFIIFYYNVISIGGIGCMLKKKDSSQLY